MRWRLDLAYDGTDFAGWATQPGLRTVQGELETWIPRVLRLDRPVLVTCAGRTDAGVHARGQVAHLDLDEGELGDPALLLRRLSRVLSDDLVVRRVARAPDGFDARFSAVWRRYAYRLWDGPTGPDPLLRREVTALRAPLDLAALDEAAADLLGLRDFAAFCRRREGATTVRTLLECSAARVSDGRLAGVVEVTVRADAFCHSMVRSVVGALSEVGLGRRDRAWLVDVAAGAARRPDVPVLPAHGLTLEEVGYPADAELAARAAEARSVRTLPPETIGTTDAVPETGGSPGSGSRSTGSPAPGASEQDTVSERRVGAPVVRGRGPGGKTEATDAVLEASGSPGPGSRTTVSPSAGRERTGHLMSHYFSNDDRSPLVRRTIGATIRGRELGFTTAGGVFSADGLDLGTAVLLRSCEPPTGNGRVLDLGCGWGAIAVALAVESPDLRVDAVDVNDRALLLCAENATAHGVADRVRALRPEEVDPQTTYDELWSNPPIRIGKEALHSLLLKWLPRLAPDGVARLVVGRNLGADTLQRWLIEQGYACDRIASAKGFRVLEVRDHRRTDSTAD